jgi:gliding motility-associated-like protein
MKRHFLTQLFNPFLAIIGYFNRNIITLKRIFIFFALFFPALAAVAQSYNNIEFIENRGQWDSRVKYKGDVSNGAFFIREGGITVLQYNPADFANAMQMLHGPKPAGTGRNNYMVRTHAYDIDFLGASTEIRSQADKQISSYNNYFYGNDQSKWAGGCPIYQAITLQNVYPNVDVRYYTDNGFLKYDIIVKPGGDVSKIALKYNGVDQVQTRKGELLIGTSVGELKESTPFTYQAGLTGRKEINCKYSVKNNVVRFDVKNYDPTATLIIDPVIVFCSFSGSSADNWGFTATYGPDGSMYGGGIVFSNGFPVSTGAYQTNFQGGGFDIGIIKLSPNGSSRVYATYIGGSGLEQPHSLIVDPQGNLILAGRTNSSNYPMTNPGQIGTGGGYDIVVTKLNAAGTAIIGSRKIGGSGDDGANISPASGLQSLQRNYGDDARSEVIIDGAGNIYLASSTQSNNFPVTAGSFQTVFGGGTQDGVLLKLNSNLSTLLFASYLGGLENDAAYVLSLAPNGNIYVAGGTESGNLRGNAVGTIGPFNQGGIDGFICNISNNGATINRTTYIGTAGIDQVFGIQFDKKGFPYIMGQTTGGWLVVNNLPGSPPIFSNAGGKQFIAKLQPDLSAYVYSTMFGSGAPMPNISPIAFLVDRCENVYISGWGGPGFGDPGFSSAGTNGLPITPDAFKSNTDGKDLYFFVLKKDAASQLFGSFFGETNTPPQFGGDHVDGGTSRFDQNGVIYQAICGNCNLGGRPPYPTTAGAYSTVNNANGAGCNLTMVKIAMNLSGVAGDVQSSINGVPRDSSGCVPLTVDFSDSIRNAQSYEWYFNYIPGNPPDTVTTAPFAQHTYIAVGTYRVMLVAIDPTTCNIRDSSFMNIKVGNLKAILDFNFFKTGGCNSLQYQFNNTSFAPPVRPFTNTSFTWNFGDGSPLVIAGLNPVTHTFPNPGPYNVSLNLTDTAYCNTPDDTTVLIDIAANVKAQFTTPALGCVQYNAVFDNITIGGQTWLWEFGDNTTSTAFEPVHLYATAGTYQVRLIAFNPNTCNLVDTSAYFTITVLDSPTPDFDFLPKPPLENTPTTFTNLSSADAVRFKWEFGDGDSLLTASRQPVKHQYNATGTFNACLTAYNAAGCDSTICKPVDAIIVPVLDVPNAFTPQSGDENSVILVRGFGIAKMQFIIWNRWGQKVFETNNRFRGWDGRVKGVVQPMDVYAYTLSVEFSDGSKTTKKGDITLIR